MKRVLHISSGNLYGGVETLLATLWRERAARPGVAPEFALCFEGRLGDELRAAGARVHELGGARVSRPLSVWRARRELSALLRRESVDLVVCHAPWTQALFGPVVREAARPLVFWMHAPATGTHWLERWARRASPDLVVCNSRFTAATARRLYPHARAEVLYCPVSFDAARRDATDESREAVRAELDTPQDAVVIVQSSRMEPWKGHALHLEALGLLRDVHGWLCWLIGGAQRPAEAAHLDELKALAARHGIAGRVRFAGQRGDVARLLAAADIYCQPNTQPEPFGLAFVEALAAGLPVVTTAHGGALEIVDDSCGVLVPPGDARQLATTLRALVENPTRRAELGGNGPARARLLCDPLAQLAALDDLFASLARRKAA